MLEAERAGAKALVFFMDSFTRNSNEWKILREIQARETHNCALIGNLLKKARAPYSHVTGKFYEKALTVQDGREQLSLLIQGLSWAVRKFEEALPTLDPEARCVFEKMRESHLCSVAALDGIVRSPS